MGALPLVRSLGSSSLVHRDWRTLFGDSLTEPDQARADDLTYGVWCRLSRFTAVITTIQVIGVNVSCGGYEVTKHWFHFLMCRDSRPGNRLRDLAPVGAGCISAGCGPFLPD